MSKNANRNVLVGPLALLPRETKRSGYINVRRMEARLNEKHGSIIDQFCILYFKCKSDYNNQKMLNGLQQHCCFYGLSRELQYEGSYTEEVSLHSNDTSGSQGLNGSI